MTITALEELSLVDRPSISIHIKVKDNGKD